MKNEFSVSGMRSCCLAFLLFSLASCSTNNKSVDSLPLATSNQAMSSLNSVEWIHGAANCENLRDEASYLEWQQLRYRDDTYIFRQNKCSNYEGPFVYLFLGQSRALLIDSGATPEGGQALLGLVRGLTDLPVLVAHSHGHGDHRLGDDAFRAARNTVVVETGQPAVVEYFGFVNWPHAMTTVDLGGREIQLLPIPGHSDDDLAYYDPLSQFLITGDALYPGRLYVRDWSAYRDSIARLADWIRDKPVAQVLGSHIEMTATPNVDYPIGTTFQPDEHRLPLSVDDVESLRASMDGMESPQRVPLGSYIIWPI